MTAADRWDQVVGLAMRTPFAILDDAVRAAFVRHVEEAVASAVAAERERCARACLDYDEGGYIGQEFAEAVRAGGGPTP